MLLLAALLAVAAAGPHMHGRMIIEHRSYLLLICDLCAFTVKRLTGVLFCRRKHHMPVEEVFLLLLNCYYSH